MVAIADRDTFFHHRQCKVSLYQMRDQPYCDDSSILLCESLKLWNDIYRHKKYENKILAVKKSFKI